MATSEKTTGLEAKTIELNTAFIDKWLGAKKFGYALCVFLALAPLFFWFFFGGTSIWLLVLISLAGLFACWLTYSELNKYRFPFKSGQCKRMTFRQDRITFEGEKLFAIPFSDVVLCQIQKTPSATSLETEFILLLVIKTKTGTYKLPDSAYLARRDAQLLFAQIKHEVDSMLQRGKL